MHQCYYIGTQYTTLTQSHHSRHWAPLALQISTLVVKSDRETKKTGNMKGSYVIEDKTEDYFISWIIQHGDG